MKIFRVSTLLLLTTLTHAEHNTGHKASSARPDVNGVRDRTDEKGSETRQALNKKDLNITKKIKNEIASDRGLASDVNDIDVITSSEQITLEGRVASEGERMKIESVAKKYAGNKKIVNDLAISAQ